MSAILVAILAYLLGGFPTGVLLSRFLLGRDVRDFGSHNPGAVNVWRIFGLKWGLAVVAVDFGKGYIAAKYFPLLGGENVWSDYPSFLGLFAVAGHIWSPFTGFRGGKGVGTIAGVALAVHPLAAVLSLSVWGVMALATKYSSVASLSAGGCFPLLVWWGGNVTRAELFAVCFVPIILILTHLENLKRLWIGTELKIGRSQSHGN